MITYPLRNDMVVRFPWLIEANALAGVFLERLGLFLWIIFNSYKFLTKESAWDMFYFRHKKADEKGFGGTSVGRVSF